MPCKPPQGLLLSRDLEAALVEEGKPPCGRACQINGMVGLIDGGIARINDLAKDGSHRDTLDEP